MPLYNGKNYFNNRVVVDYKNRSVTFTPVGQGSVLRYYFFSCVPYISILWGIVLCVPGILLMYFLGIFSAGELIEWYSALRMIYFILFPTFFLISLQFFFKPWRENCYARYNATLLYIIGLVSGRWYLPKIIKPKDLIGNVYIIPQFGNVKLDYELVGEFSEKIQKIEIVNHTKTKNGRTIDDCWKFFAIFTFDAPVRNGYMKINYI